MDNEFLKIKSTTRYYEYSSINVLSNVAMGASNLEHNTCVMIYEYENHKTQLN